MENLIEVVEAVIFAAGSPITKKDIVDKIPALTSRELEGIISELKIKYGGLSGIQLIVFADKLQFSTNPMYTDVLADVLTPIRERELSKSLLEVLVMIAYRQPVTRLELEDIRGNHSVEYQLTMLAKAGLVKVVGRKNTVGRPLLYGTTEEFLKKFQLEDLDSLPDYDQVIESIRLYEKDYNSQRETLFSERSLSNETAEEIVVEPITEIPDALKRRPADEAEQIVLPESEFFDDDDDDDEGFLTGADVDVIE